MYLFFSVFSISVYQWQLEKWHLRLHTTLSIFRIIAVTDYEVFFYYLRILYYKRIARPHSMMGLICIMLQMILLSNTNYRCGKSIRKWNIITVVRRKEKICLVPVTRPYLCFVPTLEKNSSWVRKIGPKLKYEKSGYEKNVVGCPRLWCALNPSTLQLCYTVHVANSSYKA